MPIPNRLRGITTALALLIAWAVVTPSAPAVAAASEGQAVLSPGTHGYTCYRIPALVRATDGTLVLFAEGRKPDCSDTGAHDVVLVRSRDNGRTWSTPTVVHAGRTATAHNPVPVVDARTGRISLVTTRGYRTVWVQHSDDHGATWTAPREITTSVKQPGWSGYAAGPGHGIQTTRGPHAGRLVIGTNYSVAADGRRGGALILSDDGGATWQLGAADHSADPDLRVQELSVFERPDGSLFAFARDENGANPATVASAVSTDGGLTFSVPFHAGAAEAGLAVPTVQASTLELRATDRGDRYNRVLLSAPSRQGETRERLTVRSTYKGGTEWVDPAGGTVVYSGMAAYSDMTLVDRNTVGLAYERARSWSHGYIWFTTFTEADLGLPDAASAGRPTTGDLSPAGLDAYLHGGATRVPGRFGGAVNLDGVDDHVRLPFAESLAVGGGDFTWTGWFRYGASDSTQALLWAYNQGEVYSQLWLRAEPANGRLRAWAQSGQTSATLTSTRAWADQAWHHFALRRSAATLTLHVDGVAVGSADVAGLGSVSPKRPFQIHLGQRLDGAQRLRGALDEVRLYDRALSPTEISALYTSNSALTDGLRIRLPMDTIQQP
ncbi:sialidase-1 [Micromonospora citrea]|uniref:exo-alpha-sialidase n=1 Tax=Micromonospora citrea TaxID=47855 RepID=A0A1C6TRN2_9ACTN|nr:sialidase family protein [Micromonospora citrea]SCL44466.1 sialidase-1 [Micromonospora citrea]